MTKPTRIAMWSGPRNISTTMLRAFGNREDTFASDEPFYGYYLKETNKKHPLKNEIWMRITSKGSPIKDVVEATDSAIKSVDDLKKLLNSKIK